MRGVARAKKKEQGGTHQGNAGTITFTISLSMLINFVAMGMSALGMHTPVTGALVHNAGSVLVILNAALLCDKKIVQ